MRDLRAAICNQPPAEHEYDWAMIHMPGAVQSYGVLLVVDPQSRRVQFVSENASEMLGLSAADILDKSYLNLTENERERTFLRDRIDTGTILFPNPVRLTIRERPFDAVFHSHGGQHLIEIEPASIASESYDTLSKKATAELYDPPSLDELYDRAVRVVRDVTGFDRVMLYKFDARYNGQVIAEAGREGIGSFKGLFFPSSDIGARSRQLYLKNFTRYIPDISGRTYGLAGTFPGGGHADSARPVDMSHSNLRAVAPCHVTYLQNIGVEASMSFSINIDDRLWGLFACHHYAPRLVSYEQRVICEQTAMMFIYRLAVMTSMAARVAQRQAGLAALCQSATLGTALRRRVASLAREWRGTPDAALSQTLLSGATQTIQTESGLSLPLEKPATSTDGRLTALQQRLLDLVEADSAAILHNGQILRIGDAPSEIAIYAIAAMVGRDLPDIRSGDLNIYATDCLSNIVPAAADIKDRAAGVLIAALSLNSPAYLFWFRREQIVHATWAGNPTAEGMSRSSEGLNPRASFEAWKQDIRNLSRPWLLEDLELADELARVMRGLEGGAESSVTPPLAGSASFVEPIRPRALANPPTSALGQPEPHAANGPAQVSRRVIRIGQR